MENGADCVQSVFKKIDGSFLSRLERFIHFFGGTFDRVIVEVCVDVHGSADLRVAK